MFKPIEANKFIADRIARKIINFEWDWYFKPIFDVLKLNYVINNNNAVFEALKSGSLYYQNGGFYSKTGRFSNRIALELEQMGAKYSRYGRCYRLAETKLPQNILWVIETTNAKVFADVVAIKKIMDSAIGNIEEALKGLKLVDLAEEMILDVQKRTYENFKANKIQTITPKMSDSVATQFAEEYTDNIKLNIKKWLPEDIIRMREVVGQMALDGESRITIQQYIENRFKVSQSKAKFLARNESKLAVTEYLKAKYQAEGSEEFIWYTSNDERVRDDHKELNHKTFRYDDPPIIDKRTGRRGLPGEDYGCRCNFVPVFSKFRMQQTV